MQHEQWEAGTYQQAVVTQDHGFAFWPQGGGQSLALFLAEDNTAKVLVYGLGVAIKVAGVLVEHLQRPRKSAPGLACPAVTVARCIDIGPCLVHRRMDQEAGSVGGPALVAADYFALVVNEHHV